MTATKKVANSKKRKLFETDIVKSTTFYNPNPKRLKLNEGDNQSKVQNNNSVSVNFVELNK